MKNTTAFVWFPPNTTLCFGTSRAFNEKPSVGCVLNANPFGFGDVPLVHVGVDGVVMLQPQLFLSHTLHRVHQATEALISLPQQHLRKNSPVFGLYLSF